MMRVTITDVLSGEEVDAIISMASREDAPLIKEGWSFNWRELFKTEGATFFKITRVSTPAEMEGLLMLSVYYDEMVYMNNLEVAPHNLGSNGKYDRVAGCLIAYACRYSFEAGKGNYQGFLTFDSKTKLIPLYIEKYGAIHAMGQKMFIHPEQGQKLIKEFLND